MSFYDFVDQAIALLRQRGRLSYRALQRQLGLDDAQLEDLRFELIEAQGVAADRGGTTLIWVGEAEPPQISPAVREVVAAVAAGPGLAADAPMLDAPLESSPQDPVDAERRQLSVLFCDLVGSTPLAMELDPEELREVLRDYQTVCAEVIERFGGVIARQVGDGLLVNFGYPEAHEDDAARAARAGLGILAALPALNARLSERFRPVQAHPLEVRIGLHTGLVVVGALGRSTYRDPMAVVGDTPHIAARLMALAAPNTVVVSGVTARLLGSLFEREELGPQTLKGVAEPVPVFRLTRERTPMEREAAASRMTRLVGRDAEITLMQDRWAQSKSGRGQVVLISGEPGIGKSRLVETLRTGVIAQGGVSMTFRCSQYHTSSAFHPIISHLANVLRASPDESPDVKFARLERLLGTYRFPNADTLPLFATLLAIPLPPGVPASRLTPAQQKQRTQSDLIAWLVEEAERQPVLTVWEDLQWIDPSSLEVLCLLVEQAPTMSKLTVMTCRPEFTPVWGTRAHVTGLTLGSLGPAQVEAIATAVAGGKALPAALVAQIAAKTDGVPLFVEEMTKVLLESGVLRDAGAHYELTGPLETLTIPITLHDALMARLDRLASAKKLVQLAAVIGRQFAYDLVQRLTAQDDVTLQRELRQLVDAELLYQRGQPPHTTYQFKHALVQDVAYESLLRQRRRVLHGAIAQAIEALEGERVAEQANILAYHYARSPHQDKAVTYGLLAGDQAVRLHARAEATTHYAEALRLAEGLPESPEAHQLQIDTMLKLAAVGTSREDMERDQAHLAKAHVLAEALADEPRLAQVLYWRGRLSYVRGDLQTAITYAEQSLAIADRLGNEALAAPAVNLLGRSYTIRWDCRRGSELLARSTAQMRQIGNRGEEATAAAFAATAFGLLGSFEPALTYAERGVELARELRDPFAEGAALFNRSLVHDQQGAWDRALMGYDEARKVAQGVGDGFRVYVVNLWAGWAATKSGDPAAGRILLEQAIAYAEQIGTVFVVALAKACLAECWLGLGDLANVATLGQDALTMGEKASDRFAQAVAYRALAGAAALETPSTPSGADERMNEAIRLFKELEFRPELARSYASHARLCRQGGQQAEATRYLSEAIDLFEQMGMSWDLARAEEMRRDRLPPRSR